MTQWIVFARVSDIAEGNYFSKECGGTNIVVFNLKGSFFALEDICTHDGTSLTSGQPIEGEEIVCPRHGARFCIKTGEALSPPAWEDITKFPLKVCEKKILIRDHRWD